jgi:hypothetical protein
VHGGAGRRGAPPCPILLAPALAALSTAAGAAYPPCVLALIPRLAGDDHLAAANTARATIMHLCIVVGPVLGAALLLVGSSAVAFAVNGVTFLAGAAAVAALPRSALRRPEAAAEQAGVRAGWHALRGYPDALALIGADVVAVAGLGALLPIAMVGCLPAALLVAAAFGAGTLVSEVAADTALQRSLDPAVFVRAYGIVLPAALAGIVLGALLAPVCVQLVGLNGTLVIVAGACVAYGVVVGASDRRRAAQPAWR